MKFVFATLAATAAALPWEKEVKCGFDAACGFDVIIDETTGCGFDVGSGSKSGSKDVGSASLSGNVAGGNSLMETSGNSLIDETAQQASGCSGCAACKKQGACGNCSGNCPLGTCGGQDQSSGCRQGSCGNSGSVSGDYCSGSGCDICTTSTLRNACTSGKCARATALQCIFDCIPEGCPASNQASILSCVRGCNTKYSAGWTEDECTGNCSCFVNFITSFGTGCCNGSCSPCGCASCTGSCSVDGESSIVIPATPYGEEPKKGTTGSSTPSTDDYGHPPHYEDPHEELLLALAGEWGLGSVDPRDVSAKLAKEAGYKKYGGGKTGTFSPHPAVKGKNPFAGKSRMPLDTQCGFDHKTQQWVDVKCGFDNNCGFDFECGFDAECGFDVVKNTKCGFDIAREAAGCGFDAKSNTWVNVQCGFDHNCGFDILRA